MPDPPPLNYFALGALYQRLGNHAAAVQYLSRLTEDEHYDETHRTRAVAATAPLRHDVATARISSCHRAADARRSQKSRTSASTECGEDVD